MTNNEKNALSRIFVDLIQADDILDIGEMDFLSQMEDKYKLTKENFIAAQKMDFGQSVNAIAKLPDSVIAEIVHDTEKLTISDGTCSATEAFFVMALVLSLRPEYKSYCKVISTNISNVNIEPGNFIYTETIYDKETNDIFEKDELLRYISVDFSFSGLNFVYIPRIAKDFKLMKSSYLKSVIKFLAPTLSDDKQEKLYDTLRNITTKQFCDEFLIRKMGLDPIFDSDPSVLFQVGKSNGKLIYMHVALGSDILKDLRDLVDLYNSLTQHSAHYLPSQRDNTQRFIYYGLHKALFDLMAFPGKDIESRIIIDTFKHRVIFADLGESLQLPTKQLALYIFIIHQSICTRKKELTIDTASEKVKLQNQKTFEKIYGFISSSDCSDFTIGINPALAKIRKAIKDINFLANANAYIPERKDGYIRVRIKPSNVFVTNDDGKPVPLLESVKWNSL